MNSGVFILMEIIDRTTGHPYTTGFHRLLLGKYVAPYFLGENKPACFLLTYPNGMPTSQQIFTSPVENITFYEANTTPYDPTGDYYFIDHLVITTQNTVFYLIPAPEIDDNYDEDDDEVLWKKRLN